jgi:hypothetical protein
VVLLSDSGQGREVVRAVVELDDTSPPSSSSASNNSSSPSPASVKSASEVPATALAPPQPTPIPKQPFLTMPHPSSSTSEDFLDLAVNSGSSSIKFQVYNSQRKTVLKGSANVSDDSASYKFTYSPSSAFSSSSPELSEEGDGKVNAKSYEEIFRQILGDITSEKVLGEKGVDKIRLVAHRIVHGGTADGPILIKHGDKEEKEVLEKMDEVSSFAPLHVRPPCFAFPLSTNAVLTHSRHAEPPRHAHRERVPSHPPLCRLRSLLRYPLPPHNPPISPRLRHQRARPPDARSPRSLRISWAQLREHPEADGGGVGQGGEGGELGCRASWQRRKLLLDPRWREQADDNGRDAARGYVVSFTSTSPRD